MGKELRGDEYTLLQSAEYMATTIAMWIRLATKGYHQRTMRGLCGKLIWASRPGRGAMPLLSGALAWLNCGPQKAKYTPPAVLRGGYRGQPDALAGGAGTYRSRGNIVR